MMFSLVTKKNNKPFLLSLFLQLSNFGILPILSHQNAGGKTDVFRDGLGNRQIVIAR